MYHHSFSIVTTPHCKDESALHERRIATEFSDTVDSPLFVDVSKSPFVSLAGWNANEIRRSNIGRRISPVYISIIFSFNPFAAIKLIAVQIYCKIIWYSLFWNSTILQPFEHWTMLGDWSRCKFAQFYCKQCDTHYSLTLWAVNNFWRLIAFPDLFSRIARILWLF